jgi:hypothetical protein
MSYSTKTMLLLLVSAVLLSCQQEQSSQPENAVPTEPQTEQVTDSNVVEVIAKDFMCEVQDQLRSGWTTFRLINEGHATHFFLLNKLPEGISFEKYRDEGSKVFDHVWDAIRLEGISTEAAGAMLGELLPQWYFGVKQTGGTGFIAPGETAQTTMKLEPGLYAMECYIKTETGLFHTTMGMIRPVTVIEESTGASPPEADMEMTLTNFKFEISGAPVIGENTVAVHFAEHPEFGLGNDVQLARLGEDADMQELIDWMDWMNIGGLQSPSPAYFLGGTQEMPVGNTAYFTVDLEPGHYAWIAESAAAKGMLESFVIEEAE